MLNNASTICMHSVIREIRDHVNEGRTRRAKPFLLSLGMYVRTTLYVIHFAHSMRPAPVPNHPLSPPVGSYPARMDGLVPSVSQMPFDPDACVCSCLPSFLCVHLLCRRHRSFSYFPPSLFGSLLPAACLPAVRAFPLPPACACPCRPLPSCEPETI